MLPAFTALGVAVTSNPEVNTHPGGQYPEEAEPCLPEPDPGEPLAAELQAWVFKAATPRPGPHVTAQRAHPAPALRSAGREPLT